MIFDNPIYIATLDVKGLLFELVVHGYKTEQDRQKSICYVWDKLMLVERQTLRLAHSELTPGSRTLGRESRRVQSIIDQSMFVLDECFTTKGGLSIFGMQRGRVTLSLPAPS